MKGVYLRFYVREDRKHGHQLLYEWLLQEAKRVGIHGGSAFKSMASFGRHGHLHHAHFFELQGEGTMEVEFLVSPDEAKLILDLIERERIRLVYAKIDAEIVGTEGKD